MPVDLMFFFDDRLDPDITASSLTASSTITGYAIDNAREADLCRAWKGNDGTTNDEWLQVDGGSTAWLGSTQGFVAIAYDNRGAHQETINLNYDNADNPAMTAPTTVATFNLSTADTIIKCEWSAFTIGTLKRYYRLLQPGGARTETTGTITTKILKWGMYKRAGVFQLATDYPAEGEGSFDVTEATRVATVRTAGGQPLTNLVAQSGSRFTVTFTPAGNIFKESLLVSLRSVGITQKAFFVQKESIRGAAFGSGFTLCRLVAEPKVSCTYKDQYNVVLEMETEPWL